MIDASQVGDCVSPAPSFRSSGSICIRNGCHYVTEKAVWKQMSLGDG